MRALVLAAAAVFFLGGCGGGSRQTEAPKKSAAPALPNEVKALEKAIAPPTTPASTEPGANVFEVTGEFVPPARSELTARFPGRVGRILADQGARVSRGQPMLELETSYLKIEVERAQAEAARAAASLADAERDWERKKGLLAKGSVSQSAYDRAEAAFEQAKAGRAVAQAVLALAKERLSDAVIRSPMDGVVLERRTDVGQHLADGTVAFIVVQTAPLKLSFRLPERWAGDVAPGMAVRATVEPFPGETFTGNVTVVVPAIDPASRTFTVEALFPNRDGRLRPGLFARVQLDLKGPARH